MVTSDAQTALWNEVRSELQHGEELLWVGKPLPLRVMLANSAELVGGLVSLLMVVGVLVFFSSASTPFMRSIPSFNLFLALFVGIGLFSLAKPAYTLFVATRTVYGLTDRRAIIITQTLNGRKVESYTEADQIERSSIADGKGDLIFRHERSFYRRSGRTRTRVTKIGFFGIDQVREVEAMMLKTFEDKNRNEG